MEQSVEKKPTNTMRRVARLAAVQGLYQLNLMPEPPTTLIRRFRADPTVLLQEEQSIIEVDVELFSQIVAGVCEHEAALDTMLGGTLDERLSVARLEPLLKAILRAGAFELLHHGDVSTGVIVNDYVDVAHSFFGAKEPGLVNALLDRLARVSRT